MHTLLIFENMCGDNTFEAASVHFKAINVQHRDCTMSTVLTVNYTTYKQTENVYELKNKEPNRPFRVADALEYLSAQPQCASTPRNAPTLAREI